MAGFLYAVNGLDLIRIYLCLIGELSIDLDVNHFYINFIALWQSG